MNSFYEEFGKIAFIAFLGVILVGLFSAFAAAETVSQTVEPSELIVEYNDMLMNCNTSYISTPILGGTLAVTCKDAQKIKVQINEEPIMVYEEEHISITLPTEPNTMYLVKVCAIDKYGKQTNWKKIELYVE